MENAKKKPTYWGLFINTLTLSAFTIGGGYVMIPLMRDRFVDKLGWIDKDQLAELTVLGQSAPGAMVVNATVLMGYRLMGFWGAICALLGTALPPMIMLSLVYYFYEIIRDNIYVSAAFRGMRAGVAAVIADTVVTMGAPYFRKDKALYACIMAGAFLVAWLWEVNLAFIILACGAMGAVIGAVQSRRGRA